MKFENSAKKLVLKKHFTRRPCQSLMGKLLYIQKCVHSARIIINHVLALFRKKTNKKKIYLDQEFHKDIAWFPTYI